jgi:hypothetical protein
MKADLFDFWADVPGEARVHPADAAVLDRNTHHFALRCLPIPFTGPLKTADTVLLFLSPGLNPFDLDHAMSAEGQAWHHRHRTGLEPLPGKVEHETAYSWRHRTLAHLGIDDAAAHKRLSIFNISPYHSQKFHDQHLLAVLPSCRVALDWAQEVLFPKARRSECVVVCLRAARWWGLSPGGEPEGLLFSPAVTQRGDMFHGTGRERVIAAIQQMLTREEGE